MFDACFVIKNDVSVMVKCIALHDCNALLWVFTLQLQVAICRIGKQILQDPCEMIPRYGLHFMFCGDGTKAPSLLKIQTWTCTQMFFFRS